MGIDKNYNRREVHNDHRKDISPEAVEILNKGLDYMATHPGEIGGIVLAIRPSDTSKEKHALCAMAGDLHGVMVQLAVCISAAFEEMEPHEIAASLDLILDEIPKDKKMETLDLAMGRQRDNIMNMLDEVIKYLKEGQNE